jgi:hypothetical protein
VPKLHDGIDGYSLPNPQSASSLDDVLGTSKSRIAMALRFAKLRSMRTFPFGRIQAILWKLILRFSIGEDPPTVLNSDQQKRSGRCNDFIGKLIG